jgi:hypothetical protein
LIKADGGLGGARSGMRESQDTPPPLRREPVAEDPVRPPRLVLTDDHAVLALHLGQECERTGDPVRQRRRPVPIRDPQWQVDHVPGEMRGGLLQRDDDRVRAGARPGRFRAHRAAPTVRVVVGRRWLSDMVDSFIFRDGRSFPGTLRPPGRY